MGADSKIEWTTHTSNPWWGCVEVSKLCDHCYAREWAKRYDRAKWGAAEPRLAIKGVWADLARWQKAAAAAGRIDRVFCGSMMDIFEKPLPVVDAKGEPMGVTTGDLRRRMFDEVVPASPHLLFLFLTKRPQNITKYVPPTWLERPPANVMYGTSVGDQGTADKAMPALLAVPGWRFLSCEPLLGPVDLRPYLWLTAPSTAGPWTDALGRRRWGLGSGIGGQTMSSRPSGDIHWVIGGGESGPRARPMHPTWAKSLRDQCVEAGVPYLFKQWGEWLPISDAGPECQGAPEGDVWLDKPNDPNDLPVLTYRVGKHRAGRLLDGQTWDEFPKLSEPARA